jgi:hypothetical protein
MSKQHPNQDFYKIGGSAQSDGQDRGDTRGGEKQRLAQTDAHADHPAVRRTTTAKKK